MFPKNAVKAGGYALVGGLFPAIGKEKSERPLIICQGNANTCKDGLLGNVYRDKFTSTGTYAGNTNVGIDHMTDGLTPCHDAKLEDHRRIRDRVRATHCLDYRAGRPS